MIILSEKRLKDPRIPDFVTVTRVKISKDMHYCHIYFSLLNNKNDYKLAEAGLNSASGYIQKIISEKVEIRFTPKVEFRYDLNEEKANKIDDILDQLSKKRDKSEK